MSIESFFPIIEGYSHDGTFFYAPAKQTGEKWSFEAKKTVGFRADIWGRYLRYLLLSRYDKSIQFCTDLLFGAHGFDDNGWSFFTKNQMEDIVEHLRSFCKRWREDNDDYLCRFFMMRENRLGSRPIDGTREEALIIFYERLADRIETLLSEMDNDYNLILVQGP